VLWRAFDVSTHVGDNRGAASGAYPRVGDGPSNRNHRGSLPQTVCGSVSSLRGERGQT
jgi:hypothetical protein